MGSIPSDALPTAHSSVACRSPQAAIPEAQGLLAQPIDRGLETLILDLIETILVYKLPTFTRKEIQTMLGLTDHDLKQTRFY
jgi:predicted transposase YdaD